jgi:hypothetical protein
LKNSFCSQKLVESIRDEYFEVTYTGTITSRVSRKKMSDVLNALGRSASLILPQPIGVAANVLRQYVQANGQFDVTKLVQSLGVAELTKPELSVQLAQLLTPVQQGQLQRAIDQQRDTAPDITLAQQQTPAAPNETPLIDFTGTTPWPEWIATASQQPVGSRDRTAYDAMVRFAGTTDPKVVEMVMAEVAANGVSLDEVRGATGPLSGAELRYGIGADRQAIRNQAEAEIRHLTSIITTIESNPNATRAERSQLPQMRALLQQSMNHFALATPTVGDLRGSAIAADPRFAANLAVAEAYRRGADDLAAQPGSSDRTRLSSAEASLRMRNAAGAEAFDSHIDSVISIASLKYIDASVMPSPEERTNAIRQLGVGYFHNSIEQGKALDANQWFFQSTSPEREIWRGTSNDLFFAATQGLAETDLAALSWGNNVAIGREFYGVALSELTGGLAGIFASSGGRLIQRTVVGQADDVARAGTVTGRVAPRIDYNSPAMQLELPRPNIPASVRRELGSAPLGMNNPHIHHIVQVNGTVGEQRALVREAQDILRRYDIDPLQGAENLVWAPNKGHTLAESKALTLELRLASEANAPKSVIVEILARYGTQAQGR